MMDCFYAPIIDGQLGRWTRMSGKPEHEVRDIADKMGLDRDYVETRLSYHGSITFQYKTGCIRYVQAD